MWIYPLCLGFVFVSRVVSLSQLNDESFNKTIAENEEHLWIIDFYAPWCEHCKQLEPELERLDEKLESLNIDNVHIAKVDGTEATAVAYEHSVKHYPTIFFIQSGKFHTYSGLRDAEAMLEFVKRMKADDTVFTIQEEAELQPYFDRNEIVFLLTYPEGDHSPNRPDIVKQFYKVAEDLKLSCYFALREVKLDSVIADETKKIFPTLKKMESKRTSLVYDITPQTTPSDIVDFTERHNHLLLTPLDRSNFRRLGRTGKPLIIAIVNPIQDEERSEAVLDALDDAVTDIEEADHIDTETIHNFIFGHMDGVRYRMFLSRYRATPPCILVIDLSTEHTPGEAGGGGYYVEYDVSPDSIRSVVEKTILRELHFKEILSLDLSFFGRIKKKLNDYYPWSLLCWFPILMILLTLIVPKPEDKWKKE